MARVMVDIETLGKTPEAAVIAIAAATFDGERKFLRRIEAPTGDVCSETVRWWIEQALSNRAAALGTWGKPRKWARKLSPIPRAEDFEDQMPEDEASVIKAFEGWLKEVEASEIWAKSPSFDLVILDRLWARYDRPFPVPFWKWRDVRTATQKKIIAEVPHDPMSDVMAQIEAVKDASSQSD